MHAIFHLEDLKDGRRYLVCAHLDLSLDDVKGVAYEPTEGACEASCY